VKYPPREHGAPEADTLCASGLPRPFGSFRRIVGPAEAYLTRACEICGLVPRPQPGQGFRGSPDAPMRPAPQKPGTSALTPEAQRRIAATKIPLTRPCKRRPIRPLPHTTGARRSPLLCRVRERVRVRAKLLVRKTRFRRIVVASAESLQFTKNSRASPDAPSGRPGSFAGHPRCRDAPLSKRRAQPLFSSSSRECGFVGHSSTADSRLRS